VIEVEMKVEVDGRFFSVDKTVPTVRGYGSNANEAIQLLEEEVAAIKRALESQK
jgi:hypothetical protein